MSVYLWTDLYGDHQPNRKLGGTRATAAGRLGNDDAPLRGRLEVNVVNVIAGLRDDALFNRASETLHRLLISP